MHKKNTNNKTINCEYTEIVGVNKINKCPEEALKFKLMHNMFMHTNEYHS